ncbi:MAG: hypothetical protein ACXQT2_01500 [Methanotrichaceae archaeon]
MVRLGMVRQGAVRQGTAGRGWAGLGEARCGMVRRGKAGSIFSPEGREINYWGAVRQGRARYEELIEK